MLVSNSLRSLEPPGDVNKLLTIILYKDKMEKTEKEKVTKVKSNKLGKVVIGSSLSISVS